MYCFNIENEKINGLERDYDSLPYENLKNASCMLNN